MVALHGLALATFGLIGVSPLVKGPLSFRPVSLLFVVMAASVAVFSWFSARSDGWFFRIAGTLSIAFAVSFVAIGFRWIRIESPNFYWVWMSSYHALCAVFLLYLALRVRNHGDAPSGTSVLAPA